jgi:hypothetical protein
MESRPNFVDHDIRIQNREDTWVSHRDLYMYVHVMCKTDVRYSTASRCCMCFEFCASHELNRDFFAVLKLRSAVFISNWYLAFQTSKALLVRSQKTRVCRL